MKIAAYVCLFVSLTCLFITVERCSDNASKVEAMNQHLDQNPLGEMFTGGQKLEPAMPAASKYALFFAITSGIAGMVMLVKSREERKTITPYMEAQMKQKIESDESQP